LDSLVTLVGHCCPHKYGNSLDKTKEDSLDQINQYAPESDVDEARKISTLIQQ
jgi:hypothetical protein